MRSPLFFFLTFDSFFNRAKISPMDPISHGLYTAELPGSRSFSSPVSLKDSQSSWARMFIRRMRVRFCENYCRLQAPRHALSTRPIARITLSPVSGMIFCAPLTDTVFGALGVP